MQCKSITAAIGFSDGEIDSYHKRGDVVEVLVKAWNERRIRVTFRSVICLLDCASGDIADLCEVTEQTDFLKAAVARVYEAMPSQHPYRHFQFIGIEGSGVLDVAAEVIEIAVE